MKIDYHSAEHINRQLNRPDRVTNNIAIGSWSITEINGDLVIVNNKTKKQVILARGEDESLS